MTRKSISIIALLLALLMLISTGCGKKTEEPQVINDVPVSNVPVVPVAGGNEDEYEPLSGEFFYSLIYDTVLYEGCDTFRALKYPDDGMYAFVDHGSGARICLFYGDNPLRRTVYRDPRSSWTSIQMEGLSLSKTSRDILKMQTAHIPTTLLIM